jgi:hypothetical protein
MPMYSCDNCPTFAVATEHSRLADWYIDPEIGVTLCPCCADAMIKRSFADLADNASSKGEYVPCHGGSQ